MKRTTLFPVMGLAILDPVGCRGCHPSDKEGQVTAFIQVWLGPMTGKVVLEDQMLLVEGSTVAAIGPTGRVAVPQGPVVTDGSETHPVPGLADRHVHSTDQWVDGEDWPVSPPKLHLANGVTTVRGCGHTAHIPLPLRWRDEVDAGRLDGPAICAGECVSR